MLRKFETKKKETKSKVFAHENIYACVGGWVCVCVKGQAKEKKFEENSKKGKRGGKEQRHSRQTEIDRERDRDREREREREREQRDTERERESSKFTYTSARRKVTHEGRNRAKSQKHGEQVRSVKIYKG